MIDNADLGLLLFRHPTEQDKAVLLVKKDRETGIERRIELLVDPYCHTFYDEEKKKC